VNEREEMQARAETASKARRSKEPLESIIKRAYRQDGIGLTAGEVLALTDAAASYIEVVRNAV
jgi:hypothetical protein